jgi:hypothetical protein
MAAETLLLEVLGNFCPVVCEVLISGKDEQFRSWMAKVVASNFLPQKFPLKM